MSPTKVPDDRVDPEQAWLVAGVHMVAVDEDVIVLDVRTDTYAALAGAALFLDIANGRVTAAAEVIAELKAAGLVVGAQGPARRLLPSHPIRALALPEGPARRSGDTVGFWFAWFRARRLKRAPLIDILAEYPPRPRSRAVSQEEVGRLTATFVRLLPWAPGQEACLYRAYLLRTLLRRAGADAQWVFGVRTWPFSAHCWLQLGDAVLDDDPDRIAAYTPIMTV